MIKINDAAWKAMVAHAEAKFPNECCGAMIGSIDGDVKARHPGAAARKRLLGRSRRAL